MEIKPLEPIEVSMFANLKEENQRLKEQLKVFEFEKDIKSIYLYSWSEETCIESYDESGLFRAIKTGDVSVADLHNLFLKYGYDYVNNYFKHKHDEWVKNTQEKEGETSEQTD